MPRPPRIDQIRVALQCVLIALGLDDASHAAQVKIISHTRSSMIVRLYLGPDLYQDVLIEHGGTVRRVGTHSPDDGGSVADSGGSDQQTGDQGGSHHVAPGNNAALTPARRRRSARVPVQ